MTTTLVSDLPVNSEDLEEPPISNGISELEDSHASDSFKSEPESDSEELKCTVCNESFDTRSELEAHVLQHVKLPTLCLDRVDDPKPEKSRSLAKKRIRPYKNLISQVIEPEETNGGEYPAVPKIRILLPQQLSDQVDAENARCKSAESQRSDKSQNEKLDDRSTTESPATQKSDMVELQTLPSESQSPGFPGPSPGQPDVSLSQQADHSNFWNHNNTHSSSSIDENSLQLQHRESGEKEAERHDSLLQNFLNDSADSVVSSKDSGMIIPHNETEFISLERLAGPQCGVCGERCVDQAALELHCKATGHFPPVPSSCNSLVPYSGQPQPPPSLALSNPLDTLSNLPMQQLAQQVNRLQQGQVHQQNVLINIQQFGQPPPYGGMSAADMAPPPPHMHHMPPHYGQQQPPPHHMYMPHSQYHPPPPPPHHMYYSGGSMYPPQHGHPPQHAQHPQPQPQHQPPQSVGQPRSPYHRDTGSMMPPRLPPPRMSQQQMRAQHQSQVRGQMPGRGGPVMGGRGATRGMPPRGMMQGAGRGGPTSTQQQRMMLQQQQQKRAAAQQQHEQQQQQLKKKRLDVLIPDTNDDADCHVISMQKCNDGLPIIKNVQGAATSAAEGLDPVVHLTDSITLSVRNPKDVAPVTQQKKNDAKAVANILATRGITVTPATKSQKETVTSPTSKGAAPVAINLNSAVSIIPTARNQQQQGGQNNKAPGGGLGDKTKPPTVDLTDDEPSAGGGKGTMASGKRALPHQCDLCPAQYPSMRTLVIHRRQYHKAGPQSELGVPIVDLSQPSSLSKLAALGIHSYIPLPQTGAGSNGTFALPIVSVNAARNPNICNISALGSGAVLTLGPLHHISNLSNANKQ